MRIGIVSQWYPPEPAFIPASLAQELARRGHDVKVLTGFPNYPEGRLYPGYRQRWTDVSSDGPVTVRRVPLYPSHDASAVRRIVNYASFAATSSLAARRYLSDVDVVYVYHPPATAFAAAALLKLMRRIPVVLHVQDLWPDSVVESTMVPRPALRGFGWTLDRLMRAIYRMAWSIVVIAPSMRELIIARGADPSKVHTVLNWADESVFHPVDTSPEARQVLGRRNRCTIMHAGNIGPFQAISSAIHAAAALGQRDVVDLVIVGAGIEADTARGLAEDLRADNVRFLPRQQPKVMAELYGAADFQLVSLRDLPVLRGTIPSKLQAAWSCGSPVLASAAGDCAQIVDQSGGGFSCPPENWLALADGFVKAAAIPPADRVGMGRLAREAYERHMSMSLGVDRLEVQLLTAASRRVPR